MDTWYDLQDHRNIVIPNPVTRRNKGEEICRPHEKEVSAESPWASNRHRNPCCTGWTYPDARSECFNWKWWLLFTRVTPSTVNLLADHPFVMDKVKPRTLTWERGKSGNSEQTYLIVYYFLSLFPVITCCSFLYWYTYKLVCFLLFSQLGLWVALSTLKVN